MVTRAPASQHTRAGARCRAPAKQWRSGRAQLAHSFPDNLSVHAGLITPGHSPILWASPCGIAITSFQRHGHGTQRARNPARCCSPANILLLRAHPCSNYLLRMLPPAETEACAELHDMAVARGVGGHFFSPRPCACQSPRLFALLLDMHMSTAGPVCCATAGLADSLTSLPSPGFSKLDGSCQDLSDLLGLCPSFPEASLARCVWGSWPPQPLLEVDGAAAKKGVRKKVV